MGGWLNLTPGGTGEKGDKGDPGEPGKSAYEIAVDEGFVGDETAWLASLKGDKGDPGPSKGVSETLAAATEKLGTWTIDDDGSNTSGWPNRFEFQFTNAATSLTRKTFFLNEYGEVRVIPAKTNTVPFRVFAKEFTSDAARNNSVALVQVMDNRDDRNTLFAVYPDGTVEAAGEITAPNVQERVVTWPTGSEPSLDGIPDGTLWVEYEP